ncbi:MAG: hypothetical protein DRQ55_20115 [Planctomycetota bacterium]|nr:MAG: hypothetical protein DRQ55_20115 [Planctomycetota bacterium]
MMSLFDDNTKTELVTRLGQLSGDAERQWGKMDPAQTMAHVAVALAAATGDTPAKQSLLGKLLTPFFRKAILGEKPFGKNGPTAPVFVIADGREFGEERSRVVQLIDAFVAAGPEAAGRQPHVFLGAMTGDEWGRLQAKHIDHHLRQFGA